MSLSPAGHVRTSITAFLLYLLNCLDSCLDLMRMVLLRMVLLRMVLLRMVLLRMVLFRQHLTGSEGSNFDTCSKFSSHFHNIWDTKGIGCLFLQIFIKNLLLAS